VSDGNYGANSPLIRKRGAPERVSEDHTAGGAAHTRAAFLSAAAAAAALQPFPTSTATRFVINVEFLFHFGRTIDKFQFSAALFIFFYYSFFSPFLFAPKAPFFWESLSIWLIRLRLGSKFSVPSEGTSLVTLLVIL
jgi:hypothetical protein